VKGVGGYLQLEFWGAKIFPTFISANDVDSDVLIVSHWVARSIFLVLSIYLRRSASRTRLYPQISVPSAGVFVRNSLR